MSTYRTWLSAGWLANWDLGTRPSPYKFQGQGLIVGVLVQIYISSVAWLNLWPDLSSRKMEKLQFEIT